MTSKSKDLLADLKVPASDAASDGAPEAAEETASTAAAGRPSKRRERSGREREEPTDAPQEEPPLPAPPPSKTVKVYEVVELKPRRVSWGSQDIRLVPGQRVSDERFGPGGIERLLNAGVALREVAD